MTVYAFIGVVAAVLMGITLMRVWLASVFRIWLVVTSVLTIIGIIGEVILRTAHMTFFTWYLFGVGFIFVTVSAFWRAGLRLEQGVSSRSPMMTTLAALIGIFAEYYNVFEPLGRNKLQNPRFLEGVGITLWILALVIGVWVS